MAGARVLQILLESRYLDGDAGMRLYKAELITDTELLENCNLTTEELMKPGNPVIADWKRESLIQNAKKFKSFVSPTYEENYMHARNPWQYEYLWAAYYGREDWVQLILQEDLGYFTGLNALHLKWAFEGGHVSLIRSWMFYENSHAIREDQSKIFQKRFIKCFLKAVEDGNVDLVREILEPPSEAQSENVYFVDECFVYSDIEGQPKGDDYYDHGYPKLIDAAVASGKKEMLDLLLGNPYLIAPDEFPGDHALMGGEQCLITAYENNRDDMLKTLLDSPYVDYYIYRLLDLANVKYIRYLLEEKLWIPTRQQWHYLVEKHIDPRYSRGGFEINKLIFSNLPEAERSSSRQVVSTLQPHVLATLSIEELDRLIAEHRAKLRRGPLSLQILECCSRLSEFDEKFSLLRTR
jgi:hypothetical protein